ncbi:RNAse P Rpr2/Rpp21/SNM1 subunit domain-containing protein [Rhodotorula diobovata]|uniref:RNAse P Rpr2/Rpp21/SNM1 subunit domain-containing protein n=1 Tax=Rhodotorula diobovata TaxID=5288 RepID=A0A5C5FWU8_9BASI|nr:RNAse P Rpr2/Rpp21/SNM1 subunit domain-containing protein [Rhodotorula diobovata]
MAKKGRNTAAEPTAATPVPSREALQRLSFLYQASALLNDAIQPRPTKRRRTDKDTRGVIAAEQPPSGVEAAPPHAGGRAMAEGLSASLDTAPVRSRARTNRQIHEPVDPLKPLARHLAREMTEVAKKATVRMDPGVKRTVCKGCGTVLVPGVSASVRIKPSGPHAHLIVHRCLSCHAERRFPAPPHLPPSALPDGAALEGTLQDAVDTPAPPTRQTRRERREARQARTPVFFEREGHVLVRGGAVVPPDGVRGQ